MAKFVVTVEEILRRSYIVEAKNSLAAENRLRNAYMDEDVVLDADDWCHAEFETEWEATEDDIRCYKNLDDVL